MSKSLDIEQSELKSLLDKSTELVLKQFENILDQDGYNSFPQQEVERWFDEPLPLEGMDNNKLLNIVEEKIINTATGNIGPNMYAYVMAGGNQIGIIAEKLSATINQNVGKWHLAPAINEIEKRVVQWASEMIGYGENIGGNLISGGSSANFAGLTVARNVFFEKMEIRKNGLFNMKPFLVYCSDQTHSCVDKSIESLGIGSNQLRKIKTNNDFTINVSELQSQIEKDISNGFLPFCIIGNAGTVNTGAIDDFISLSKIANQYKMWFHIDGAYGGLASSLNSKKHLYKGIDLADSVALDFHKWLYQPFEVGCLLVKNWDVLKRTYFKKASYLDTELEKETNRLDFNEHGFQLSRNAKALKVWMSIKSYGINRIKEMIQKDIDLTSYLNESIKSSDDFILKATSELAVSCFQYKGKLNNDAEIVTLNKNLIPALEKDGRVFITGTKLNGEFVIRACLINHRKNKASVDYLLNVIREVANDIM